MASLLCGALSTYLGSFWFLLQMLMTLYYKPYHVALPNILSDSWQILYGICGSKRPYKVGYKLVYKPII